LATTIGSAQLEHDEDAEGAAYNDLGLLHLKQSDYLAARRYLHLAEIIGNKNGNIRWIATSSHLLARLDAAEGREDQALQGFQRVLDMVADGGTEYRELEAGTRHRLGVLAMRVNRRSDAATYFHEALRLRSENLAGKADTLTELAELHRTQGELGSAESHLEVAMRLHRRTRDRAVAARTCEVMAKVRRDKGDLVTATHCARRSVDCHDRVGNTIGKAVALDLLASLRSSSRAFAAAEEGWLQALQIFTDAGDARASSISEKLARLTAGGPVPQSRGPADHVVRQ
jgi:tetratricopeptide (TPR) repeat protein